MMMSRLVELVVVVVVVGCVHGLYSPSDEVIELTPSNFNTKVLQSADLWLVEFYAPWYVFKF